MLLDADDSSADRWQSLRDSIAKAGYENIPSEPDPDGTILDPPINALLPRVGVWVMPNNRTSGMLEDFLRTLVPSGNVLLDYARRCVQGIPEGQRLFAPSADSKAIMHTWLAWQNKPGRPFGTAITARYLDADVPEATAFVAWLEKLFFS